MKNRSKIRRIALWSISGRKAPKSIGGRNAGEDRAGTQGWRSPARTQCRLRGEAFVGSTLSLAAFSGSSGVQRMFRARSRAGASRDD